MSGRGARGWVVPSSKAAVAEEKANPLAREPTRGAAAVLSAAFAIGVAVMVACLLVWGATTGESQWLASALLVGVSAMPLVRAIRKGALLSWTAAVVAYYFIFVGISPVVQHLLGVEDITQIRGFSGAMLYSGVAVAAFTIGATLTRAGLRPPARPPTVLPHGIVAPLGEIAPAASLALVGVGATAYSFAFGYFGLANALYQVGALSGVMASLAPVADAVLVVATIQAVGTRKRRWRILWLFIVVVQVGFGLLSKSKGILLMPFVLAGVAYYTIKGRIPVAALAAVVAGYIFVAYPLVTTWRRVAAADLKRTELVGEGLEVLRELDLWALPWEDEEFGAATGRGVVPLLSRIVADSGATVEFGRGDTLVDAVGFLVPRAVWADKPTMNIGNRMAHTFGAINYQDDVTNLAPTFVGEFYYNFGGVGVAVGMLLCGAVAAWIDRRLVAHLGSWFLPWTFWRAFMGQEATVGHTMVPIVLSTVILVAVSGLVSAFTKRPSVVQRKRLSSL